MNTLIKITYVLLLLSFAGAAQAQLDSVMTAGSELQIRHRKKDKVRTAEIGDYLVVKDQFAKHKGNLSALEEPYLIVLDDGQELDIRQIRSIRLDHSLFRVFSGYTVMAVGGYTTFLGALSGVVGVLGILTSDFGALAVFGVILLPAGLLILAAGRAILHKYNNGKRWSYQIAPLPGISTESDN